MYGIVYENIKKPRVILVESAERLAAICDKWDHSGFFVAGEDDMKVIPAGVLTILYNAANPEKDPIKKFESRTIANRRVFMVLGSLAKAAPTVDAEAEEVSAGPSGFGTVTDADDAGASPVAAKAKSKRAKKAKVPATAVAKVAKVSIPKGSRFKGPFAQGRAPSHVRNWPKSAAEPVAPRDGTKGAKVLTMLRKGTTYEKIKAAFDWTSQGVSDALSYLRRCGFGIKTDGDGAMSIVE